MGWVNDERKELAAGRAVRSRAFGGSMRGRIEGGQLVTIASVDAAGAKVDDVVLAKWHENYLLHLVKDPRGGEFLIGNNVGKVNGWVRACAVIGEVVAVGEDVAG